MDMILLTGRPFVLQVVLLLVLFLAAFLARKKFLKPHCLVMRIAMVVLIVNVVGWMIPSFVAHKRAGLPLDWFEVELFVHAAIGFTLIGVWIFINLAFMGIVKWQKRLVWPMRVAFGLWLVNFALGTHIYLSGRL